MKNVTVTLEEDVAKWARVRAATENKSVSRLLGEMLKEKMTKEEDYKLAKNRYLSKKPTKLSKSGKYPSRSHLYER